jgi:uncharacterized protein YqeY
MILLEQVDKDIKDAMRSKDADKLQALRGLKSALQLKMTEKPNVVLSSDDELQVVQKSLKTRRESFDIYTEQNRPDLAENEKKEIDFIEAYLPKQLDPAEVERIIEQIVLTSGAKDIKDMGKVMGLATKEIAGRSDNKTVSMIIRNMLGA